MIQKGNFRSVWDEGIIITPATLDTETGYVDAKSVESNFDHLIDEHFESEDGDEFEVCDTCHEYILKTVMVDGIGSCLDEIQVCSNPECDNNE